MVSFCARAVLSALALTARNVPPGAQVIHPSYSVYKCLTASNINKAAPTIQDCVPGMENQLWLVSNVTVATVHNKCLDVPNGKKFNRQKLQVYSCASGNLNQQFTYNGSVFQWTGTNKCMDLTDGKRANGVVPQLYTCNGNANQQWNLADPPPIPAPVTPTYPDGCPNRIIPIKSQTTCATALSNSDRAEVVVEPCDNSDNQAFRFQGGQWRIFSDKCLDVTGGKGTKLQISTCGDSQNKNQQFSLFTPDEFPRAYQIQWKGSNLCVDLTSGSITNGNKIQLYTCSDSNLVNTNQYWYINHNIQQKGYNPTEFIDCCH